MYGCIFAGEIPYGSFISIITLVGNIASPIFQLAGYLSSSMSAAGSLQLIDQVLLSQEVEGNDGPGKLSSKEYEAFEEEISRGGYDTACIGTCPCTCGAPSRSMCCSSAGHKTKTGANLQNMRTPAPASAVTALGMECSSETTPRLVMQNEIEIRELYFKYGMTWSDVNTARDSKEDKQESFDRASGSVLRDTMNPVSSTGENGAGEREEGEEVDITKDLSGSGAATLVEEPGASPPTRLSAWNTLLKQTQLK